MVAAIIILSIALILATTAAIVFYKIMTTLGRSIQNIYENLLALDFVTHPETPIPEELIEEKYEDATLIVNFCQCDSSIAALEIFDISQYMENKIISLTTFAQGQCFDETAEPYIVPHCDIYRLRNGEWIWRQNYNDGS